MKLSKKAAVILAVILLAGSYIFYAIKTKTPFAEQKPAVNELAPAISLADLAGKMISLSDFKGKVVLVNFWASWCPPCKAELKEFQKVYEAYEDKGFAVIAIAIDDISPSIIQDMSLTYPVVTTNQRVTKDYGSISDVPVSFLIGKDGRIIKKVKKVYPENALKNDVENALKAGG